MNSILGVKAYLAGLSQHLFAVCPIGITEYHSRLLSTVSQADLELGQSKNQIRTKHSELGQYPAPQRNKPESAEQQVNIAPRSPMRFKRRYC